MNNPNENKWILANDEGKESFDSFEEASKAFLKKIQEYLKSEEDAIDSSFVPFSIGAFFNYKYDQGIITDEEIAVYTRLERLLDSFHRSDKDWLKSAALRTISHDIHYQGTIEEFGEKFSLAVEKGEGELYLRAILMEEDDSTYITTNAFLMDDPLKSYCFVSHQIVTTSKNGEKLGKAVDCRIWLENEAHQTGIADILSQPE